MKYLNLSDVCLITMGQSPDSKSYNKNQIGLPFFQGNADFGEIHPIPTTWCTEPKKIAEIDDILLSVRAPIGDLNIADERCVIGRGLASIRIIRTDIIDKTYLYSFLESVAPFLQNQGTGTTFKAINRGTLDELKIPCPELSDQKIISEHISDIKKALKIKNNEFLAFSELVKSRFIEMFGNPILNEKNWRTEELSKAAPFVRYSGVIAKTDGKVWILNLDMVESGTGSIIEKVYAEESDIGASTIRFTSDFVLYSKLRPYLNKVVLPDEDGYATSELVPMLPNQYVNKIFLTYLLRSESFVEYMVSTSGGAKMPRASMDAIREFKLIIPNIELQNEFAEFVKLIDKSKFVCHSKYFL